MGDASAVAVAALPSDEVLDDGRWVTTLGARNVDVLAAEIAELIAFIELIGPPADVVARLAEIGGELVSRFGAVPER